MPITRQQALEYFESPDLIGLGFEADAVRRRLHPEGVVTYIIDRNINYTNYCTEYCTFCAFYRPLPINGKPHPNSSDGYILEFETICDKIAETLEMGGTGVLMQGGIHPDLKIDWFERLFRGIKVRFPANLAALSFRVRSPRHRGVFKPRPAHHHRTPARCRARLHPRRRRGDSRRRGPPSHRAPQMRHRRLGQRAPDCSSTWHAHHRDHDVRRWRKFRSAHQPF